MSPFELQHLKVDTLYLFTLKDGRKLRRKGVWLMDCVQSGLWRMNKEKCEMVTEYKEL